MSYPIEDALTCPFCPEGENKQLDLFHIGTDTHWVHCSGCQCDGPQAHTQEIAIRRWNRTEPRTKITIEQPEEEDEQHESRI